MATEFKPYQTSVEEDIPEWAIYYLEYGEGDALSDDDIEQIEDFLSGYEQAGYYIDSIVPMEDYGSFTAFPPFGLACNTIKCTITYTVTKEEPDF